MTAFIDAGPACRQLQELAAAGFPVSWIADQIGVSTQSLSSIRSGQQPTTRLYTVHSIGRLYDRVRGTVAPEHRIPEGSSAVARLIAARNGWTGAPAAPLPAAENPEPTPAARPVDLLRPLLTERRLTILRHAANGRSNQEIADLLGVGHETVKVSMGIIQRRLGARDRAHAVAIALVRQIIAPAGIDLPDLNPPLRRGPMPRPRPGPAELMAAPHPA